jgi:hypothetical protein
MLTKENLRVEDSNFYNIPVINEEPIRHRVTDEDVYDPGRIMFLYEYPFDQWPVILRFNNIIDPFEDLIPGMVLQIPTKQSLKDLELKK